MKYLDSVEPIAEQIATIARTAWSPLSVHIGTPLQLPEVPYAVVYLERAEYEPMSMHTESESLSFSITLVYERPGGVVEYDKARLANMLIQRLHEGPAFGPAYRARVESVAFDEEFDETADLAAITVQFVCAVEVDRIVA